MFYNFRNSMAVCVMVFILLSGCAAHGQTSEDVRFVDDLSESILQVEEETQVEGQPQEHDENTSDLPSAQDDPQAESDESGGKAAIYVDVCGAVISPGVVRMPEGSRVFEAIEKAGGLGQDADGSYINKARILSDGEQIYVPTKEETASSAFHRTDGHTGTATDGTAGTTGESGIGSSRSQGVSADGKVNINTADSATLQTLTGIGESRAEAIILYRETNGAFETIEDIMKVTGIKNALFNNIKNDITVE